MIVKQGTNFTTAKIFKKVCKTLFVTVTILSPNFLLNDLLQNHCWYIKLIRKITENVHMTKVTFLHHFCRWALTFSYSNISAHCFICSSYVTLRHHVDVKTSLALSYMANCAKVYYAKMNISWDPSYNAGNGMYMFTGIVGKIFVRPYTK